MKTIPIYQIDAFTNELFKGNPAAVCPLDTWVSEELMQSIAAENNLSETAFYVQKGDVFEIRWFTPTNEVSLCGHATLAAAYVEFFVNNNKAEVLRFVNLKKQILSVSLQKDLIELGFPSDEVQQIELSIDMQKAFDVAPIEAYKASEDMVLVFENEQQIQNIQPNLSVITQLNCRGIIATAKGENIDVVCRFFAPKYGINEDPVTGSAHTVLVPFWSKRLGKTKIVSKQLSKRTGILFCEFDGDSVKMSGHAKLYLKGEIYLG